MPSTTTETPIRERIWAQRNVTIYTALLVALPITYAFSTVFGPDGSFLLLLTVGVVVPTAYNECWPPYDRTWKAVGWTTVASMVAAVAFATAFTLAVRLFAASALVASGGAFVVTAVGGFASLARWRRR
ncbi:hypothetical protein [Salinigranum marinum]|uniref:hypothetical protein n=1 Tax=Salinigranum marinum TaxID=1515595 RepID=UPI002989FBA0|nr:hypothetical protein [Salinigranum marinum]